MYQHRHRGPSDHLVRYATQEQPRQATPPVRFEGDQADSYPEDVTDGLENAPRELIGLLRGENFGKKIIRVGPDRRSGA